MSNGMRRNVGSLIVLFGMAAEVFALHAKWVFRGREQGTTCVALWVVAGCAPLVMVLGFLLVRRSLRGVE